MKARSLALIALFALSAPALAQKRQPRDPRKPKVLSGGPELTPAEREALRELERDMERFAAAAERHQARTRSILLRRYEQQKASLEDRYSSRISAADNAQMTRRLNAIEILEKFVKNYPNHPQFTPDSMFRLADLYLDQANADFEKAFDAQADAELADDADLDDLDDDSELVADYSKAIGMWGGIVERFPEYRQRGSSLYLLAYYLKQTGEDRRALQVARGLVCGNKYDPTAAPEPAPSREQVREALAQSGKIQLDPYANCTPATQERNIIEDAWVRIVGDIHFLTPGELGNAIAAYQRIEKDKESNFYDEALYKLAWSYYRNDNFLEGIRAFDESIKYSDSLVAKGQEPLELRPEALQYIAISFTDPWSVEEQPDPVRAFERAYSFYKERLEEPHVRDVFVQLGDTFEILEAWDQAIDSWKIALKYYPVHVDNPTVHQKVVTAFQSKGERELADEEAARMTTLYAPGSEWYKANETDREAMLLAGRIGESMLKSAALNMHRTAQEARKEYGETPSEEKKERYVGLYRKAGELYKRFVAENPTSPDVYEFTYFLGDALFWAEDYMAAIEHYRWVRDHQDLSSKRFKKAALSIVQSYEKEIERQVAAGELAKPPEPTVEDLKGMKGSIKSMDVPRIFKQWQAALDEYQNLVKDPESAPTMGYLAGLISYRFLNLDDAAKRFEYTVTKFCGEENAVKAKDALLAIYEARGEDEKFQATNERFIKEQCGSETDIRLAKAQNRSKKFREAEALTLDGDHDYAAVSFFRYYKKNPDDDPNKPVALYNAALNYDKAGKPKTAVYLYKEFTESPLKSFRDSEYYLTALYLTAVSYNNAFDYENAVKTYLNVVDVAGQRGRKAPAGIDLSLAEIQRTSIYNAAVLRELDRVYEGKTGAVALYRRYATLSSDRKERDKALWAVARIYKNSDQLGRLAKAYAEWRQAHGRDKDNADKYVYSYYMLAKEYEKRGQTRFANNMKKETIRAWESIGQPKGGAAADMAGEFGFENAQAFQKSSFDKFRINKPPKTKKEAEAVLDKLDSTADSARAKYRALSRYESGVWGLGALVRIGDTFFFQGLKLKEAPVPKEIEQLDEKFPDKDILLQYQDAIDKIAQPLIDQAALQWEKVVTAGRQKGVANQWTRLAQERLHDFIDQSRFPVLRQDIVKGTEQP